MTPERKAMQKEIDRLTLLIGCRMAEVCDLVARRKELGKKIKMLDEENGKKGKAKP